MDPGCSAELEFEHVARLIAHDAKTEPGRAMICQTDALPSFGEGVLRARLTREVLRLLDEGEPLSFAGIDAAIPWLDPSAPPPQEPPELLELLSLARRIATLRRQLLAFPGELELLTELGRRLPDTSGLVEWAAPRLGRDGTVSDDASPRLASLRREISRARQKVLTELEAFRRSHKDAVTDAPPTVRRDRYCVPVRSTFRSHVAGLVLDASATGQTIFLEPYEVVELNNTLVTAASREREEIRRILAEITTAFSSAIPDFRRAVDTIARLDAAQARALFGRAIEGRLVMPGEGDGLVLRSARHPLLDERLAERRREVLGEGVRSDRTVVPLDLDLSDTTRTLLVSGPNAGGKTVVLKTIGLMVVMAYHGVPLPVDDGTQIARFDDLWCLIGDEQDVAADLSTFSAAMQATARLLHRAAEGTLVLYDELGAGTDPLEGAALGAAILEELNRRRCTTVATSHLQTIAQFVSGHEGMDNAAMGYDEDAERPTYRLQIGRPGRSRGTEIAHRMAVPSNVLERAGEMLGGRHLELERWLERLETLEGELARERAHLARERRAVADEQRMLEGRRQELEADRAGLRDELRREREALRRTARRKLDDALHRLDRAVEASEHIGRRRREKLRQRTLDIGDAREAPPTTLADPSPGDRVKVRSLGAQGTVEAVRADRLRVAVGGKHVWVATNDVIALDAPTGSARRVEVDLAVSPPEDRELKLLGKDSETAREELERFLDQALTAGAVRVRVVHGHGTGTLRRTVTEVCRAHPAVSAFAHPPQSRGGTGVTEIDLAGADDG